MRVLIFKRMWVSGLSLILLCAACEPQNVSESTGSEADASITEVEADPAPEERAPKPACVPFEPEVQHPELMPRDGAPPPVVLICPDEATLEEAVAERDPLKAPEAVSPSTFEDPVAAQEGMAIYDHALRETSKLAWFVPLLFNGTPPLGKAQVEFFDDNKRLAAAFVDIWKTPGGGTPEAYSWTGGKRWRKLAPLMKRYKRKKDVIRHLLLRDGMLFVEDARAASDIYRFVGLPDLFDEKEIWLRRGDSVHKLSRRDKWTYVFAEGVRKGERARLLIFDRVALSEAALAPRLGWDLNRLRPTLGLKAFRIKSHAPDLLRGEAVLRSEGRLPGVAFEREGLLHVAVIVSPEDEAETMARIKADRAGAAMKRGILIAGEEMMGEELRFDEPKTEEGQQDGMLRIMWGHAYKAGHHSYTFNGDRYTVFTREGQPNVPQVCIDFIYDTLERWSGRWWAPKGSPRQRIEGFIDARSWIGAREKRQVSRLVASASRYPKQMDLLDFPQDKRIPYADKERFYNRIEELGKDTLPGDIITIYGLKKDNRNHWHSFLVYDLDPVYNTPYLLIGNAGHARIQVWHDVMRTGPKRAITARIRWREDWLAAQRQAWLSERAEASP